MLRPPLTRFRLSALLTFLLCGWAYAEERLDLVLVLLALLLVLIVLGVTLPQFRLFGPFICHGPATRRWVALTFDDGPDPDSTPALLDLLREAGVQAAFFCVGRRVEEHPEIAARIVREGHLLENHSYSHSHFTNIFTVARLRQELQRTQDAIQRAAGVVPTMFRPPMGLSNPRIFRAARDLGLSVIGWNARGLDTLQRDPDRVVARIVRQLRPGGVILLHDGSVPPDRLLPAVKRLLDTLATLGYEVVRFDRMQT